MRNKESKTSNPFESLVLPEKQRLLEWLKTADLEVFPDQKILPQLIGVPERSISITSSPSRSIEHTIDFSKTITSLGWPVIPHIAARHIRNKDHAVQIATELKSSGINHIFTIAGDNDPVGEFHTTTQLLKTLSQEGINFQKIGIAGYPEGHPLIATQDLDLALMEKQQLANDLGIDMYLVTQICFDENKILNWIAEIRAKGITIPVVVGVPGAVNLNSLINFAARCGVGDSKSFLQKKLDFVLSLGRGTILGYKPDELIVNLAKFSSQEISGLHLYTFNNVSKTNDWIDQTKQQLSC